MYRNLTNFSDKVDDAFLFILSIILFFFVALTAALVIFIVKYRSKEGRKAAQIHGNRTIEIIWTIVPLILVLAMFYYGWRGWKPMFSKAPKDAMVIITTSRMWSWSFDYENGKRTDSLYVPVNKAVKLNLESPDVIHSLYIPAFRLKQDIVPGHEKSVWFVANDTGRYDIFCAEYCGLRHSYMYSAVIVMPQEKFDAWYIDTTLKPVVAGAVTEHEGLRILKNNGCITCHSLDGSKLVGPSYKGIYGEEVTVLTNGESRILTVDEEYIKRSIYEPDADVVKGYNKGLMLSYEGQVSDEDINKIIDYLKNLN